MSDGRGIPLGRYLLTERLAMGGMGEVYLAIQRGMGAFEKPLALKLLLPHLTEDVRAVQMFLDEARVAARMNHPNIVQIFDVGLADKRYYLAMELVRGVALSTLISSLSEKKVELSAPLFTFIARSLLSGLQHAHEMVGPDGRALHIVHRDVTPHNVLISEAGEVKLTDFGIAKTRDTASRTAPGTIKGKYEYIAPEQAAGDEPDRRADLYSAGISLFHLATGRSPYRRDRDVQTIQAVMSEPLPPLGSLRPDLPNELVELIRAMTAKQPRDRPASAKAALAMLPPPSLEEDPKALGKLVRTHCGQQVTRLEQQTKHALEMGNATRDDVLPLGVGDVETTTDKHAVAAGPTVMTTSGGSRDLRRVSIPLVIGASVMGSLLSVALVVAVFRYTEPEPKQPVPEHTVVKTPVTFDDAGLEAKVIDEKPIEPKITVTQTDPIETKVEPKNDPPPIKTPPPDRQIKVAAAQVGYVSVDAVPWAKVSISGKTIGETPIAKFPVEKGQVLVVLHNPDTGKTVKKKVKVAAGKVAYVKEDLR